MTDSRIQPEMFVRHSNRGVAKVAEVDGNLADAVFWASKESGKTDKVAPGLLTPLADDSPEALLWERPEKLELWATEAPLKLVALALSVGGGVDKTANVKKALVGVPGCKSSAWWNPTQAKLKLPELQQHFEISKTNITLLSGVDAVPANADLLAFLRSKWHRWLLDDPDGPVPWVEWPIKESFDALDNVLTKLKERDSESALASTIRGAEGFLASRKKPIQPAVNWLETLGRAHESLEPDSGGDLALRTGETLLQLSEVAGYAKSGKWLLQAQTLIGMPESWQQGFAAGMWASSGGSGSSARRKLFRAASALMGPQGRADLAREIALAAFGADYAPPKYAELEQLLEDSTPEGERVQRIYELIALASAAAVKDKVLDYIANSRRGTDSDRLGELTLATLLLSDGHGPVPDLTSTGLAKAFVEPEKYASAIQSVFRDTRTRLAEEHARKDLEMAELRQSYEARLERERREQERLLEQLQTFRAQMSSGREESRLEIRQGMLLAIGDIIQRAYWEGRTPEERLSDVIATLPTALGEGGAEPLGTAGETVSYDPTLHHSAEGTSKGVPVRLSAPGVVVRGGPFGDRVILKASVVQRVVQQSEVS